MTTLIHPLVVRALTQSEWTSRGRPVSDVLAAASVNRNIDSMSKSVRGRARDIHHGALGLSGAVSIEDITGDDIASSTCVSSCRSDSR